jgi:hypothetical protein
MAANLPLKYSNQKRYNCRIGNMNYKIGKKKVERLFLGVNRGF